jgi:hypothetical protein
MSIDETVEHSVVGRALLRFGERRATRSPPGPFMAGRWSSADWPIDAQ